MYSVAVQKPDQLEIVEIPKPVPGPYQALIRSEAACLCNMTDRKLIEGHFPGVEQYPLLLGHESVGIVLQDRTSALFLKWSSQIHIECP